MDPTEAMYRFLDTAKPMGNWLLATATPAATKWIAAATPFVSSSNDWFDFVQNLFSAASRLLSNTSGEYHQEMKKELNRLERCMISLPGLISQAEWFIHRENVAPLLHGLKGRMLDAHDMLDHFSYSERQRAKVKVSSSDCNRVKEIREDIEHHEGKLEELIDRRTAVKRFEECIRPDMGYNRDESLVRGRDNQINEVIQRLVVPLLQEMQHASAPTPATSKRRAKAEPASRPKRTRAAAATMPANEPSGRENGGEPSSVQSHEQRTSHVSALAVVGIGGIGKTTLAQKIFNDERVRGHFDLRIWISVCNDFDVLRLTKEFVQRALEHELEFGHLSTVQGILSGGMGSKKFLLVLDDVWDDLYTNHENKWQSFLQPLRCAQPGSMVLLTARSLKVAEEVNRNENIALEGLPDDIVKELFHDCAFGSDRSRYDQELDNIGARMLPHLKGCPLAAKTLGRLLSCMLNRDSWNRIAGSELWQLNQQNDDILPVFRLSYQYLPTHQRSCFSFCSMHPKGYKFDSDSLVEQWIAAGLLDSLNGDPEINGRIFFHNFLNRSLFQKAPASDKYVMHDLMHDMAQLVSGKECFTVKSKDDLERIPKDVRHLSILNSSGIDSTKLECLCKYKKLRSLVCHGIPSDIVTPAAQCWFKELKNIRILSFISCTLDHLPESIGNLKLLRYLNIADCTLETLPKSFWRLYNLQVVIAQNCTLQRIPEDYRQLTELRKFRLRNTLVSQPGLVP